MSVVVPSYNVTRYIAQALDSVLEQTYQEFEIIVVNDGCPDTLALERILKPYRPRIRYIRQKNMGLSGARNSGIRAARGEFILNLDPDDWLEPHCLESQVQMIREQELDALYCNTVFTGDPVLEGTCWMDHYPSTGQVSFLSVIESRTCPTNPGSIIRRDTLTRIGLYDTMLRSWEDYDVWLRILKAVQPGRIGYNPRPLAHYRQHSASLTKQPKYMEYALRVLEKADATFELTTEERAALNKRHGDARFDVEMLRGKRAIVESDWTTARQHFAYCSQRRRTLKLRGVLFALDYFPYVLSLGPTMFAGRYPGLSSGQTQN